MLTALLLALFTPAAHAQVVDGLWTFGYQSTTLGELLVTNGSPPSGFVANREYWGWTGTPWPANDIRIEPGSTNPSASTSDVYTAADFPASATQQLPTSLGSGDRMYAVSICDSGDNCDNAGYLWVISGGTTLRWYLRSDWPTARLAPASGEVIHLDHLVSAPSNSDFFRYLSHDEL